MKTKREIPNKKCPNLKNVIFFININFKAPKKIKTLRPLIKESALDEPRIRNGKFIPHTQNHKNLMRNLELVRKSQPIFKPNMPGEKPMKKNSIDIETGNQPLLKSINDYIKNVAKDEEEGNKEEEPMKSSIVVNEMVALSSSQNLKNFQTGASYEDFREIEKTLRNSIQTDNIHSIISSQNEVILSQKGI
jgi:hypothetical protein